jgi:hypothetical protein
MTRRCPDTSKMDALLNRPVVPLEEGIQRLAEHKSKQRSFGSDVALFRKSA